MNESAQSFLNVGCGRRFHAEWVNVDFQSPHPLVMAHDIRRGIPFSNDSFDFVYHSHVLEHFRRDEARTFLRECHRVLKPGCVIRVAVPDLEGIVRLYLQALGRARHGDVDWQHNYDWMMIELFDQAVRETSGGEHGAYLGGGTIPNLDFVLARHGIEAERSIASGKSARTTEPPSGVAHRSRPWGDVWKPKRLLTAFYRARIVPRLLGYEFELLRLGRFRRSGEVHQWMYDSYSLSKALVDAGFESPRRVGAAESRLPGWTRFCLDTEQDGRVYKPDSIYLEATKGDGHTQHDVDGKGSSDR